MVKAMKVNELIGPQSISEAAEKYIRNPEELSSDTKTVLGYLYRDYQASYKDKVSFPAYALGRWMDDTFPKDALV